MIPVKLHEGKLVDKAGKIIEPNENGLVEIEVEGKMKRFVPEKLVDYLERNGQVYKEPIFRRNKDGKIKVKKKYNYRVKNGKVGHHRRKKVVITDKEGKVFEFESITKASTELKISACRMFPVLTGKRETLKGYKIKYAV